MKKAFSLVELSVAVLVIAIIIAGVTQSSALLQKAKAQSAQTLTKNSPVAGIEGLLAWFEPTLPESFITSEAEEGQLVTQWNDINPQTSNKLYMTNSFNGNTYLDQYYSKSSGIGGLPSIYFGGGSAHLYLSNSPSAGGNIGLNSAKQTVFIVYRTNLATEFQCFDSWRLEFFPGYGYPYPYHLNDGTNELTSVVTTSPNSEITSFTIGSGRANLYVNGSNVISTASVENLSNSSAFVINSRDAYFSEIIAYDRILKDEERQSIEQYLGSKYGIEVVKTATPAP